MERPHGKCQAGAYLFSPTTVGIVRLVVEQGKLLVTEFPCNKQLNQVNLIAGNNGLIAHDRGANQISTLTVG